MHTNMHTNLHINIHININTNILPFAKCIFKFEDPKEVSIY